MNHVLTGVGLLLACLAAGCSSPPETETGPVTAEDLARRAERERQEPVLGKVESRNFLFTTLDQNLRTWRTLSTSGEWTKQYQLESLELAITNHVYKNFDTILTELLEGDPHYRPIAAAALGFSVIPAPDEPGGRPDYPQVHPRAVQPLVSVLDEGNDALTQNALLSLARIRSPDTPLDLVFELLLTHHEENVRSNAALVAARVLGPEHRDAALSTLYAALEDSSAKVRLHVVTALGRLKDPGIHGQMVAVMTQDDSELVQANAARVLGEVAGETAIPYLIQGLGIKAIRTECRRGLVRITGEDLGPSLERWTSWYRRRG